MNAYLGAMISSISAGFLVTLSSVMTEKFGGHIGGVIASSPSTTVPTSIAIALESRYEDLQEAMSSVAVIITINALYLYLWRVLPGFLKVDPRLKLGFVLLSSLTLWFLITSVYFIFVNTFASSSALRWISMFCLCAHLVFGLLLGHFDPKETPSGGNPVEWPTLALRGALAIFVVLLAIIFATFNSFIGGIIGASPVISTMTLASVWYSQGERVCVGTTLAMILGSISVSVFAISFSLLVPQVGIFGAALLSYFVSVFGCSIPVTGISYYFRAFKDTHELNEISSIPLQVLKLKSDQDEEKLLAEESESL